MKQWYASQTGEDGEDMERDLAERIAELEAENARLREALARADEFIALAPEHLASPLCNCEHCAAYKETLAAYRAALPRRPVGVNQPL